MISFPDYIEIMTGKPLTEWQRKIAEEIPKSQNFQKNSALTREGKANDIQMGKTKQTEPIKQLSQITL